MNDRDGQGDLRFEEGMAALEALVERLESGELALEDALLAFEQGVALFNDGDFGGARRVDAPGAAA